MNDKKYVLTISILASNRKDTLPKTLESISPILDNVSSELIVTDTGCDEELLGIIRQYTDKIVKFKWCKDFSKARNVSIEAAKGEWYLYIDDDEWFEDVTEFIDFFNSDEKDKYGMGRYIQRNYNNLEGNSWSDAIAGRLFKLNKGTCFKDVIHEMPINISGPIKNFSSYVHHYGYVYKTEEERLAHRRRNLSLLLEQVDKEPTVARHYSHIAQEYYGASELDNVVETVKKGLKYIDKSTGDAKRNVPGLFAFHISVLEKQKKYEDILTIGKEYIQNELCSELGQAMLSGLCAAAAYNLKRYEESIQYAKKFFELKDYIHSNPELEYAQSTAMLIYSFEKGSCINTAQIGVLSAVEIKNIECVEWFANRLLEHNAHEVIDAKGCMVKVVEEVSSSGNYMDYVHLFETLMNIEPYMVTLMSVIEELRDKDMKAFLKMANVMSDTTIENGNVQYLRIICRFNKVSNEELKEMYKNVIESISDLVALKHEFWIVAANYGIDIQEMLNYTSISDWMVSVETWSINVKVKELLEKKQDLDRVLDANSIHMKCFDMIFIEALMFRKKLEGITLSSLVDELRNYCKIVIGFYNNLYNDEVFQRFPSVLPYRCQVALDIERMCNEGGVLEEEIEKRIETSMPRWKRLLDKYKELTI